jgi:hypothetical protein
MVAPCRVQQLGIGGLQGPLMEVNEERDVLAGVGLDFIKTC